MHVDEDFAQAAVLIFAGAQIHLMAANNGFLGIALAPLGQLFAVGADDFLDDHLFDDLFGQHLRLGGRVAGGQDFFRLFVILDQGRGQRLRQFRAVAVQRVGLDAQ